MNNEELKKKIVKIIRNMDSNSDTLDAITLGDIKQIADALVAAGIGDVKEAEHRAEKVERAFRNFLAEYFTAVNEQNSYNCGIPEMFGWYTNVLPYEDKVTSMLNEYLNEAEKDLAEKKQK